MTLRLVCSLSFVRSLKLVVGASGHEDQTGPE